MPPLPSAPSLIAAAIQLSIAPIFLLAGIGALLNVMTSRLSRVVDRARALEAGLDGGESGEERARHLAELRVLDRRMTYANRAITLCSVAALLICCVVALLFVGQILRLPFDLVIAVLFILTMGALVLGLVQFLVEIAVATRQLRVRAIYLRQEVEAADAVSGD
jgi:hypothetical protein